MKAVWKRIHSWHEENAPADYGSLRPGASNETIRAAEKTMELKLPTDVKASYRIHDGQSTEPGLVGGEGWRLLSLKEVVEVWGRWSRADPNDAHYVPIAWGEMNDYVFLNLDPTSENPGCLMIQRHDSADPHPFESSFSAWLTDFADTLEDGEFAYSEDHGFVMYADELDLD
jgi:cell wall assembly regulator SMI1